MMDIFNTIILTSIAGGLVSSLVVWIILERKSNISISKRILIVLIFACIIIPFISIAQFQNTVIIPDLNGLSQREAEAELIHLGLRPVAEYKKSDTTPDGYVIPDSQYPYAGTSVMTGERVTFFIGERTPVIIPSLYPTLFQPLTQKNVSLLSPKMDDTVDYRTIIRGTSSAIYSTPYSIYLVVQPLETGDYWVQPKVIILPDGEWSTIAYFGSDISDKDRGKKFTIYSIITRTDLPEGQLMSLSSLKDTTILDTVIVTRR